MVDHLIHSCKTWRHHYHSLLAGKLFYVAGKCELMIIIFAAYYGENVTSKLEWKLP